MNAPGYPEGMKPQELNYLWREERPLEVTKKVTGQVRDCSEMLGLSV